ncbi:hypothetical protein [Corynebacterium bovis]|uniref:hypothetical protein n=1 Tax=Corynebacterium bovis TaxID=36808 RepID=UPI000F64A9C9|nr:hypothetical protein [Corynebacterium bovis]
MTTAWVSAAGLNFAPRAETASMSRPVCVATVVRFWRKRVVAPRESSSFGAGNGLGDDPTGGVAGGVTGGVVPGGRVGS